MKLVKVTDQEELAENVSLEAILLVSYLNRLLAADPEAITKLIDHAVPVNFVAVETMFPHMVIREEVSSGSEKVALEQDRHATAHLSGLGIISGFTNTARYRVYAEFPNDVPPYGNITHFGLFRVEEGSAETVTS